LKLKNKNIWVENVFVNPGGIRCYLLDNLISDGTKIILLTTFSEWICFETMPAPAMGLGRGDGDREGEGEGFGDGEREVEGLGRGEGEGRGDLESDGLGAGFGLRMGRGGTPACWLAPWPIVKAICPPPPTPIPFSWSKSLDGGPRGGGDGGWRGGGDGGLDTRVRTQREMIDDDLKKNPLDKKIPCVYSFIQLMMLNCLGNEKNAGGE